MKDLVNTIFKGADKVDEFTESAEERQATLSERHKTDMASDNWLSKSIRPITLIVLLGLQMIMVILSAFGRHVDPAIVSQHGVLLLGAFSFYFHSKKVERVAEKNAAANIKIEEMRLKHSQKIERKEIRAENRARRRAERTQDKD